MGGHKYQNCRPMQACSTSLIKLKKINISKCSTQNKTMAIHQFAKILTLRHESWARPHMVFRRSLFVNHAQVKNTVPHRCSSRPFESLQMCTLVPWDSQYSEKKEAPSARQRHVGCPSDPTELLLPQVSLTCQRRLLPPSPSQCQLSFPPWKCHHRWPTQDFKESKRKKDFFFFIFTEKRVTPESDFVFRSGVAGNLHSPCNKLQLIYYAVNDVRMNIT